MKLERVIIIRDKTRLEQLIERFNSKAQARFYIERSGGDFDFYVAEHNTFYASLNRMQENLGLKYKVIFRSFLPTYIFSQDELIVVIGQDGLVANTAKYVSGLPIIAVNPDENSYDGILLPHTPKNVGIAVKSVIRDTCELKEITMAGARLNDGQTLLAFNDFYIGTNSHVSSRYTIQYAGKTENQSSSGVLVSTGAGSTGWLSSVFNMANNVNRFHGKDMQLSSRLAWNDQRLMFAVREPFISKTTQADIGFGILERNQELVLESKMPINGVIFSDGIETDFLQFNSGAVVRISTAKEKAVLVF